MVQTQPDLERILRDLSGYLLPGPLCQRQDSQWLLFGFNGKKLASDRGYLFLEGPVFYQSTPANFGKELAKWTREFRKVRSLRIGRDCWRRPFRKWLSTGYAQLEEVSLQEALARGYVTTRQLEPFADMLKELLDGLRSAKISALATPTVPAVPWS